MRVWLVLFFCLPFFTEAAPSEVRVRIERQKTSLQIAGWGLRVAGQSIPGFEKLRIERLQKNQKTIWQILSAKKNFESDAQILKVSGRDLRLNGLEVPSELDLIAKKRIFDVVSHVPLEDYLYGVLASEMPISWPLEALKAQAIAARSYTWATALERRRLHFDVDNNVMDQVFRTATSHGLNSEQKEKVRTVLDQTRGQILFDDKGKVLKTFYHADCGGRTTPAKIVWGFGDKGPVVVDSSCPGHPKSNWKLSLRLDEIQKRMQKKWGAEIGPLKNLWALRSTNADRAHQVRVEFQDGAKRILNAHEFREALGFFELRSTHFNISTEDQIVTFSGRGWGHGVGLCQWGSRSLAIQGERAEGILRHYFPLSNLQTSLEARQKSN